MNEVTDLSLIDKILKPQLSINPQSYSNIPVLNSEIKLTDNGKEIFNRRYRRRDADGNFTESIEETYMRVANHVANAENDDITKKYFSHIFYNLLTNLEFIPNAPTWTGSGTPLGQLAACFVLPIEDDMGSTPEGIFSTLRNAALIQQTGGGNGFSFSRLRPKGDVVKSSMGEASGPVGFLQVYDAAFEEIAQGGIRRGANMAVLRVDHPDIRQFITCKSKEGKVKNFNISIAVTDVFMNAVKNDSDFDLINPHDHKIWETVKAREIFNLMVENAWANGEPGILYIDEANRYNPVPNQYELEATNPCGEQWLGPYENCCLGHINLIQHVKDGEINWEKLAKTIHTAVRFLDNIVTVNAYVPAIPQLQEAATNNRRIGLGFTALADLMYALNVRYGSKEGIDLASQIAQFLRFHAIQESIYLATERGAFPKIEGSIYDPTNFKWQIPNSLNEVKNNFAMPELNWEEIKANLLTCGIRNSAQTTVAPTGSTSTVLGVEGYGCEPVFALAYERNVYQAAGKGEKLTLKYISPLFEKVINEQSIADELKNEIINEIIKSGSCQNISSLPKLIREVFVVSSDIGSAEHVETQAAIQAFVDNSISKTCNFPTEATKEAIEKTYFQAWELKCRGLTIYRAGSRDEIVLETQDTKNKKNQSNLESEYIVRPRENSLIGVTQKVATPLGNMYLTVNKTSEDDYHEVFINLGKAGSDVRADTEALGKLISLLFRLGAANSKQRMKAIIHELEGISSGMVSGFNGERVLSVPDAIAKGLKRIDDPEKYESKQEVLQLFDKGTDMVNLAEVVEKEMCPMCGNYSVLMVEGCKKCSPQFGGCGEYSAC